MLITGMSISGKMSVGIFISANGVASRISIAITMNVYGRRSASSTTEKPEPARRLDSGRASGGNSWRGSVIERRF